MLSQLLPMLAITFGVFVLFFLFMGIGYMFKKQPLRGSCGGVAKLMGEEKCSYCGDDPNKCETITAEQQINAVRSAQLGKPAL
ncbi:(Na+)-NQR maturation NqrM [Psychrobacter sp. TAE2020]|uniref:(Na+)-NQR maturation NqrM n=1 Tax=Psychrobacter sp. TAE2020 TaxID=2846762 RepID=UPI001C1014D1|nr:(Na+)-NQR maturation NqrM [Psychrobacter sp. TAE2020]MBU5617177.1 (Na+)-NQR maturation NqrM [Psychrobacter sp. TAE2020]